MDSVSRRLADMSISSDEDVFALLGGVEPPSVRPRYTNPAGVWAIPIREVTIDSLIFEDSGYAPFFLGTDWIETHQPKPGDYYVLRTDGTLGDGLKTCMSKVAFETLFERVAN